MQRFNMLLPTTASMCRFLILLCAVLALESATTLAQRVTLRAGGGGQVLTRPDDLDTYLGSGTNLMLDLSVQPFSMSFPGLEVVTTSTFDRFTLNESDLLIFYPPDITAAVSDIDGGDLSFYTGSIGLRYTIVNSDIPSKPYVTFGAGMYHYRYRPGVFLNEEGNTIEVRTTDGEILALEGEEIISTALGWNAGIGLDFDITDTYGFFVEAQYVVVRNGEYGDAITDVRTFGDDATTRYYPIRFGATIRLAAFGVSARLSPGDE